MKERKTVYCARWIYAIGFSVFIILLNNASPVYSAATLPWSTTLNCADWQQNNGLSCDGIGNYGSWTCDGSHFDQITIAANNPSGGGGKGFRHWKGPGVNQTGGGVRFTTPTMTEFWMRYYMKIPTTFNSGTNQWYDKQVYINHTSAAGICFEQGRDAHNVLSSSLGQNNFFNSGTGFNGVNGGQIGDGKWHSYEFHIKKDTNGSDGVIELWIDGVPGGSRTNVNLNGRNHSGWDEFIIGDNQSGNLSSGCQAIDFDDIAISTTGYIGPLGGSGGGSTADITAPTVPTNLAATAASSSQINLTWTASTDAVGVSGYNIYRGGSLIGTSSTNSYSNAGLSPSTQYAYKVSAYDAAGNSSVQSSSASATTPAQASAATLLSDGFEANNLSTVWGADWALGGATRVTSPVHGGSYSLSIPSTNVGSYIRAFGDNPLGGPGVDGVFRDDVTVEHWYYLPSGFVFPPVELKIWIMNSFDAWGAFPLSAGQSKPNAFAPYYMTIAMLPTGQYYGELTRADGLGGPGELWRGYPQNVGSPVLARIGQWERIKYRLKLNTVGQSNGIFQLWINDVLKADYSTINYRGTYTAHGWNHLMLIPHFNNSVPKAENVYYDDVTLTSGPTQPGSGPLFPNSPLNIMIQ